MRRRQVDKVTCSYKVFWNCAKIVASRMGLSAADKALVFHDTAAAVYGIAQGTKRSAESAL